MDVFSFFFINNIQHISNAAIAIIGSILSSLSYLMYFIAIHVYETFFFKRGHFCVFCDILAIAFETHHMTYKHIIKFYEAFFVLSRSGLPFEN